MSVTAMRRPAAPKIAAPLVPAGEFIAAMRQAATGVTVVTTGGPAGRLGVTVSAFSSVSADPPLVLVCVNRRSPVAAAIRGNAAFTVNLLAAGQAPLADNFAGRPREGAAFDFATAAWADAISNNCPQLEGAAATFHCRLHEASDLGSHTIFIGAVIATSTTDSTPLVCTAQRYARPHFLDQ